MCIIVCHKTLYLLKIPPSRNNQIFISLKMRYMNKKYPTTIFLIDHNISQCTCVKHPSSEDCSNVCIIKERMNTHVKV